MEDEHRTSHVQRRTPKPNPRSEIRNLKSRALGQYFTPEPVVALCYRMLRTLDPDASNPRIIDPACGEGAFISCALDHGITTPDRIFGVEKDPAIAETIRLPGTNLFTGDGLSPSNTWHPAKSEIPDPKSEMMFDWVVGNPPFGTGGLGSADHEQLKADYTIWRGNGRGDTDISRYPIEILFLERFVQLAKPGGHIAIIVPDGILANARLSYVREWLWQHAEVKAVISLPQHTFQRHGAAAKASVLLLRRRTEYGRMRVWECGSVQAWDYTGPVPPHIHTPILPRSPIARLDPAYYHPRFTENLRLLESRPDTVRLGDLIELTTYGQVGSRQYSESGVRLLTPANLALADDGYVADVNVHSPEHFVPEGSRNDPPRSRLRRGDLLLANSGVGCIGRAAVFHSDEPCNISQHINLVRLTPPGPPLSRGGDKATPPLAHGGSKTILPLAHGGNKTTAPLAHGGNKTTLPLDKGGVGGVRVCVEPEYVAVYLQTQFGRLQIDREKCGVGPCGINFDRIKSILIPVLPEDKRREIVEGYRHRAIGDLVERLESLILSG